MSDIRSEHIFADMDVDLRRKAIERKSESKWKLAAAASSGTQRCTSTADYETGEFIDCNWRAQTQSAVLWVYSSVAATPLNLTLNLTLKQSFPCCKVICKLVIILFFPETVFSLPSNTFSARREQSNVMNIQCVQYIQLRNRCAALQSHQ